ncbi:MAG: hypothetical protein MUO43_14385 [Desulfobacterales bacterium]|nr:hypothetical protein [Desulfobacterales bacterium]
MIKINKSLLLGFAILLILLSSGCLVKTLEGHTYIKDGAPPNDNIQFFQGTYVKTIYGVYEEGKPYSFSGEYEVKNGYVYLYHPNLTQEFELDGGRLTDGLGNVWIAQ